MPDSMFLRCFLWIENKYVCKEAGNTWKLDTNLFVICVAITQIENIQKTQKEMPSNSRTEAHVHRQTQLSVYRKILKTVFI